MTTHKISLSKSLMRRSIARFAALRQWDKVYDKDRYFAVTSGTITDEMINEYINEQEGEPVEDDSRFQIDPS